MTDAEPDRSLQTLLDMVGVFVSEEGWWVKTEAKRTPVSPERPFGVRYSLTLHDKSGARVLGYDNAHGISAHRRVEWDHKHVRDRVQPYDYENAAKLLRDFYADVDRWLERGN